MTFELVWLHNLRKNYDQFLLHIFGRFSAVEPIWSTLRANRGQHLNSTQYSDFTLLNILNQIMLSNCVKSSASHSENIFWAKISELGA